jgi:hypothetical protein
MDKDKSGDPNLLPIRFLLGEMTDEERIEVECRCLADDDFFATVLDAEQALLREYAEGTMAVRVRERFETYYLASPRRAAGVRLEQALRQGSQPAPGVAKRPAPAVAAGYSRLRRLFSFRRPVLHLALATVGVAAVIAVAVLAVLNHQLHERLVRTESDLARSQAKAEQRAPSAYTPTTTQAGVPAPADRLLAMPGAIVAISLEPGLLRGNDPPSRVTLTAESQLVWLRLLVGANPYSSYRVVVSTPEGRQLVRFDSMKAKKTDSGLEVDVMLPASLFTDATTCLVRLAGLQTGRSAEDLGVYTLDIVR